jgi:exodeoxyribonuclease VII small subunit
MKKNLNFETAMKRLEELVEKMESGEAELDKSLEWFEEGIKLVKYCSQKLDEAKNKVEILTNKNGVMKPEPFDR